MTDQPLKATKTNRRATSRQRMFRRPSLRARNRALRNKPHLDGATGQQFNQAPHSQPQQPAGQGTYTPGDYSQQPPSPYGQPPSPYQQPFGQNSPYGQPNQYGQTPLMAR